MKEHPPEDDLKLLRWNDEKLDGKGYVDWYPFDHPQLGQVELGGWDVMYCWGNVPPQFLERGDRTALRLALWHLLISPRLEVKSLDVEPSRRGTAYKVRLVSRTRVGCRRTSPRRRSSARPCARSRSS